MVNPATQSRPLPEAGERAEPSNAPVLNVVPFDSTPSRFLAQAARLGQQPAYFVRGIHGWEPHSWTEFAAEAQTAARALIALGVQRGDVVCILGFNRPEWVIMDHAAMMVGAVPAGFTGRARPTRWATSSTTPRRPWSWWKTKIATSGWRCSAASCRICATW